MKTHRWHSANTTIDLTFTTNTLREQLLQCKVAHHLDCDSDHLPIGIELNWEWKKATPRRTRLWASTDINKLKLVVQADMHLPQPPSFDSPETLDNSVTRLVRTLTTAIDKSTP